MTEPSPIAPHPPLQSYYGDESREQFVREIFDDTAPWYDTVGSIMSLGSGERYRLDALARAGVKPGIRMLDVATGTGVVARAARKLAGERGITGLDPSIGMLLAGREAQRMPCVQSVGETVPFRDDTFDLLTVGFALRHLADLNVAFREWRRVLRPGGRLLVMEITPPRSRIGFALLNLYMGRLVPMATRVRTGSAEAAKLMHYYWDTIRSCVPPDTILSAMSGAGFEDAARHVEMGIFSEYTGTKT